MTIHFVDTDHQQHAHGTSSSAIKKAVAVTDSLVGTVMETIKEAGMWDDTAIIITGDHGHTNTKATFAPNVYLVKHGLITKGGWKAKFNAAGGSGFLYVKDKNKQAIVDSVVAILKDTPEYKNGDFRILDRSTLDQMGANPNVELALAMKEGITVRNGLEGKPLETKDGTQSTHGNDPSYPSMKTAFIAVGAGIGKHKNIKNMGIKNIAPVIDKLLELDFKAPEGKLIPGILTKGEN